jgi:N-acetyl sugar amidotransferase
MNPEANSQEQELEAFFGLPAKVHYCKKCVESNQRMMGSVQHKDTATTKKKTALFDEDGVCLSCRYFEKKRNFDWEARDKELRDLCDRFRRKDGYYDVLVPGSGGKDGRSVAHILKTRYNMNPLTVTWAPHIYTEIGWRNFQSWIHSGLDNFLCTPNGKVHRTLTRLAFENLLHPFQPFVLGQYYLAPRIAIEKNIPFIMYGDSYAEKGLGGDLKWDGRQMDPRLYTSENVEDIYLGGVPIKELGQHGIDRRDLNPYLPLSQQQVADAKLEIYFMPYFINYDPQKNYYYAVEHTGFEVNPDGRTEGTYTKYQSLDDKVDGFHYYTWYIKTGRGRTTEDAALEVRNGHIQREEAVALVKRFDGEFPKKYFNEFLDYMGISETRFWEIIDRYRSPHIWKRENGEWKLRQQVS